MTEVSIPIDLTVERELLGALLWDENGSVLEQCQPWVSAEDFYRDAHREIWRSLERLAASATKIDAFAVFNDMRAHGGATGELSGYLSELMSVPGVGASSAPTAASEIRKGAKLRKALELATRQGQIIDERDNYASLDDALLALASVSAEMLSVVDEFGMAAKPSGYRRWSELHRLYPSLRPDWLVEDLLLAEDVWMLLGGEGAGKSFVSRQFCLSLAGGVHPFSHQPIPPVRTLHVDLENSPGMVALETRMLLAQVGRLGDWDDERARVWNQEDGIDLRSPRDQRILESLVDDSGCQFMSIGSLYKAYQRGDDSWESAAHDVRAFLDHLRRRYKLALLLEHHMPKASSSSTERPATPYGSLVWQQWPSLGNIIERIGDNCYQLHTFRGGRMAEQRRMPCALFRGGELPWSPIYDEEEMWFLAWEERKPGKRTKVRRPVA